jgi:hypothetical protein
LYILIEGCLSYIKFTSQPLDDSSFYKLLAFWAFRSLTALSILFLSLSTGHDSWCYKRHWIVQRLKLVNHTGGLLVLRELEQLTVPVQSLQRWMPGRLLFKAVGSELYRSLLCFIGVVGWRIPFSRQLPVTLYALFISLVTAPGRCSAECGAGEDRRAMHGAAMIYIQRLAAALPLPPLVRLQEEPIRCVSACFIVKCTVPVLLGLLLPLAVLAALEEASRCDYAAINELGTAIHQGPRTIALINCGLVLATVPVVLSVTHLLSDIFLNG